jgi:gamma-glutamylcyclotransferase (GGCT)/AIG2-like uncharacterized protein YtfP
MNVSQTQQRCPGITRIGTFQLEGFRLVFNYHADIVPAEGCIVHGGLWNITEDHEVALDTYEGYPTYYDKYFQNDVMFYRMAEASEDLLPPAKWYLKTVIQGYKDFGLTQEDFAESLGVQQLGLTQTDLEERLGVPMDELEQLFSRLATFPVYR